MEKTIEKVINRLLLSKHGLNCDVVNFEPKESYDFYGVIINVRYSDIYPTLGGNLSVLDFLDNSNLMDKIFDVLKYINLSSFDFHSSVFYHITDIENLVELERTFNDGLEKVNESYDQFCLKKIVLRQSFSVYKDDWLSEPSKDILKSIYGDNIYTKPFPVSEFHLISNCVRTKSYLETLYSQVPGLAYTISKAVYID